MPLTTPASASEVIARAINDVSATMAPLGAKPSLKNSWINALIVAYSRRIWDFYYALDQAALEALPDTAVDLLERWAAIWLPDGRIAGTRSTGNAIASGVLGSTIGLGAVLTTGDGKEYDVDAAVDITTKSLSVASITRSGTTATLTTTANHELGGQILISVTGADQAEYNVTDAVATITGNKTLTYEVSGAPATPATGTILLGFDSATLAVNSVEFGEDEDQVFDSALTFVNPIVGVDNVARVDFDALGGGADQETLTALRERLLDRIQNPIAHFNVAELTAVAKAVAGVTRVWVQEITPAVGQVKIFFMRDNEDPAIPSTGEVAIVDAAIQAIRPANSDTADVVVAAPVAEVVDFTFTDIQPDTSSMRAAVEASLAQFFAEKPELETNVDADAYRSAIYNTVDPTNGATISTFTLSIPGGDIAVGDGEIATLGSITWT
jgi:hypothetical protein